MGLIYLGRNILQGNRRASNKLPQSLGRKRTKEGPFPKHQENLKEYPDNQVSRFFKAKHYFAKAEAEYQKELAKYQKIENATTYTSLRRELTSISEDYRKLRDILLYLQKMNPNPKAYMLLLRNCYTRLNNKAEVTKLTN
jgi:hypothetical protein